MAFKAMATKLKNKKGSKEATKPVQDDAVEDYDYSKQYDVERHLGAGAFAVVQQVKRKGDVEGPTVWTPSDLRKRLEFATNLLRNVETECPNLSRFYEYHITKTHLITFQELFLGGDLFDRITKAEDAHLTEEDARGAARGLCSALKWAHSHGTIHRDVKPENALFKSPESRGHEIVLIDFGCCVSKTPEKPFHTGKAGTPGYLSPEMIAGKPYDESTDGFSLGITVYEMLTGRSPLISETPEDLEQEVLERAIPYPARYWSMHSSLARDFTKGLLEKDASRRLTMDAALKHPWLTGEVPNVTRQDSTASDGADSVASNESAPLVLRKTRRTVAQKPEHCTATPTDNVVGIVTGGAELQESGNMHIYDAEAVLDGRVDSPRLTTLQSIGSLASSVESCKLDK